MLELKGQTQPQKDEDKTPITDVVALTPLRRDNMRKASTKCTDMIMVACGNEDPVHMSHEDAVSSEAAVAAAQEEPVTATEDGIPDMPDTPVVTTETMKAPRGMPVRFS